MLVKVEELMVLDEVFDEVLVLEEVLVFFDEVLVLEEVFVFFDEVLLVKELLLVSR